MGLFSFSEPFNTTRQRVTIGGADPRPVTDDFTLSQPRTRPTGAGVFADGETRS